MKQKQRPLQEVAKEILKRYKEHEEMFIEMTSDNVEEKEKQLGFLDIDVGMYANEIERASAELDRHGKWIDDSNGIEGAWNYCSVCGEQAIDLYDFCPNCGAKMDAERKEE